MKTPQEVTDLAITGMLFMLKGNKGTPLFDDYVDAITELSCRMVLVKKSEEKEKD